MKTGESTRIRENTHEDGRTPHNDVKTAHEDGRILMKT